MPYCQLYYHFVWATRNREPVLTPQHEAIVYDLMRSKAYGLGGTVYALNGTDDHVHLIASVPPRLAVAQFIGQVKGVSSARFNKLSPSSSFYWQEAYGVFTFDRKRLDPLIRYVENQKVHHAEGSLIPALERVDEPAEKAAGLRETAASYETADSESMWWREMMDLG
jgi:putative transposase